MTTTQTRELEEPPAAQMFLLPREVAFELGISRYDVRRLREAGLGPAYFSIGPTVRYLVTDVDEWRAAHPNGVEIPGARDRDEGR